MARVRTIPLENVHLCAGSEHFVLDAATLVVRQEYLGDGTILGMRRWAIVPTGVPLPFALSRAEYLQFEAGGYSGRCTWGGHSLVGTGTLNEPK